MSGKLKGTSVVAAQKGTTVTVEKLFYNLPVRRRELERNIKREWGRVISLLNQYACIMTGVKFAVSQQPNKGKKIVLFSTKGNATTRDNIINVFGAKTMSALIPMDLKLKFEPTKPSALQKAAGRTERGTTEVVVRGHISRPASGEGRQTPDRQMFFVNGRPCGLPQFAKVFNEAYRAYNATQSPFIFADIQLDTDLYDVNVSPDKREILLHDQTKMLDSLREMITELFDKQDYTIPVATLSVAKFPGFKKASEVSQTSPESEAVNSRKSRFVPINVAPPTEREPQASDGEDPEDDSGSQSPNEAGPRKRNPATSGKSLARDSTNLSLTARWAERGTATRGEGSSATQNAVPTKVNEGSLLETPAARNFGTNDATDEAIHDTEGETPSQEVAKWLPAEAGRKVRDFHTCLARLNQPNKAKGTEDKGEASEPQVSGNKEGPRQQPIPALPTPSTRAMPLRSPSTARYHLSSSPQPVATITVGDHTVTDIIGSIPSNKTLGRSSSNRAPRTSSKSTGKRSRPTPSFGGRLTQLFGAPGSSGGPSRNERTIPDEADEETSQESDAEETRSQEDDDEEYEEEEEEEEEEAGESEQEDDITMTEPKPQEQDDTPAEGDGEMDAGENLRDSTRNKSPQPEDELFVPDGDAEDGEADRREEILQQAEESTKRAAVESQKRGTAFTKGISRKNDSIVHYGMRLRTNEETIHRQFESLAAYRDAATRKQNGDTTSTDADGGPADDITAKDAEEKLSSLIVSKSDFLSMRIVGQFNLGFIIAVRPGGSVAPKSSKSSATCARKSDELFIIDQHATDEKYNFERLQTVTVVASQPLVAPKTLDLTALDEEIIAANLPALEKNGFLVSVDQSGESPVGRRCTLLGLPLSKETTFGLEDLEELISLLSSGSHDDQSSSGHRVTGPFGAASTVDSEGIPRPSRVRRMLAMRACRGSVMIGKPLTISQMSRLVRHMAELDKPWNCPHGRPTMRHLCSLDAIFGDGRRGSNEDDNDVGDKDGRGVWGWKEPGYDGSGFWTAYLNGEQTA